MAGSLAHILNDDGTFRGLDLIDSDRDKREALEECHQIIAELLEFLTLVQSGFVHNWSVSDKRLMIRTACERLGFPVPTLDNTVRRPPGLPELNVVKYPVIQPELHGHASVYKPVEPKEWLVWREGTDTSRGGWRVTPTCTSDAMDRATKYTRAEADKWEKLKGHIAVRVPEQLAGQ
jgi:hypothetical protein